MSTKHFFPTTEGVVVQGLTSLCARNSHLSLDASNKVVYDITASRDKISLISGGGSGHEPAWSGYVGSGMLSAAVNGEVFASPNTKQVLAAIEHVPSNVGVILCITNYTGDNLHFGLAREKAVARGLKVGLLKMTDDVGLGREQTRRLGRRGLAGNMFILKLCGAASVLSYSFEDTFALGQSVNDHCVTIGSSLDYCHIPGRTHHEALPADTYSVAQGIHNEAGLKQCSPIPSPEEMVSQLLQYLLDPTDKDRAFVNFNKDDETAVLLNNFGGMSNFELEALTGITTKLLSKDWDVNPKRILVGCFETSLNAPGWSISLLNLTGTSQETGIPVKTLLSLLNAPTDAPAWPRNGYRDIQSSSTKDANTAASSQTSTQSSLLSKGPKVDPKFLHTLLKTACTRTIEAEPNITKWDIQMGDGDCGEATSSICSSILRRLDQGLCSASGFASDSDSDSDSGGGLYLFPILDVLGDCTEDVGGTLGAILAIFLASFTSSLRAGLVDANSASEDAEPVISEPQLALAAQKALGNLKRYTSARVGGRTVMDTLIPFCETFSQTEDFEKAVRAGVQGAKATKGMSATFGRASYVGGKEGGEDVPMDPGAWALAVFLEGLLEGEK